MVPTWVSPYDIPCSICTAASIASGGSCAVISQRAVAQRPPITTRIAGGKATRGDSANTTISASTPSAHSAAMVSPPSPDACQVMEAKL